VQVSVDGILAGSIPTNAAGNWIFTPPVADGTHVVSVTGSDLAGNSTTANLTFTLDTTAPAAPPIGNFTYVTNVAANTLTSYTISGTAEAGSTVVLSNGAVLGTATAAANGSWSFTIAPVPSSNIVSTLSVTATDIAGNRSGAQQFGLLVGTGAANTLAATGLNAGIPNVLIGMAGNDTLTGSTGNDRLDGGTGSDLMTGGLGDDTYVVDAAGDVVVEASGGGTDTVLTSLAAYTLTANVENLTYTGAASFAGTGNVLANVITGGIGADTLNDGGGAGIDTLAGGLGNDTYIVSNAGEVNEAAGGGTDTVRTTLAAYTLDANVENLTFIGAGNFAGTGNTLANVITGGAGNDTLDDGGGAGADRLIGGAGNDTYIISNAGDVVTEAAGAGTDTVQTTLGSYILGTNLENLTYTGAGSFTGTGNTLANVITGGSGNDTLSDGGGAGVDTLRGGLGDDTYIVANAGDLIQDSGGTDTVRTALASYTLGTGLDNLVYTGAAAFTGTGNALANVITGGAANDTLNDGGGSGIDTLTGGLGNDTYIVSNAGEVNEAAGGGTDTVRTALGAYTLDANVENLVYTGAASFAGTGNALVNSISGGIGNDTLDGGKNTTGADTMIGGGGDDTYVINNVGDVVTEAAGAGNDTANVLINSYTLATNVEVLNFIGTGAFSGTGNALANVMTGGAGADTLNGAGGDDRLIGGAGADTLIGGAGNDIFVLAKGDANGDLIADFSRVGLNNTDQILLSGYGVGASLLKTVVGNATTPTSYAVQVGGVTQDTFRLTGNITLGANDFRFV